MPGAGTLACRSLLTRSLLLRGGSLAAGSATVFLLNLLIRVIHPASAAEWLAFLSPPMDLSYPSNEP